MPPLHRQVVARAVVVLGRVLARVIYGFRLSTLFALILVGLSSVVGITLGALQGY